jgi:hypothetical protein
MHPAAPESIAPDAAAALTRWALGYLDAGAYTRAEQLLSGLADLMDAYPLPRAGAALAAFLANNAGAAQDHLTELSARFPTSPLRGRLARLIRTGKRTDTKRSHFLANR